MNVLYSEYIVFSIVYGEKKYSESDKIKIDSVFYVCTESDKKQEKQMSEFTFTKRDATFVKRFIKMCAEDFAKDIELKKQMDSDMFKTEIKDKMDDDAGDYIFKARRGLTKAIVIMGIEYEYCFKDDEDDEDVDRDIDMESLKPYIKVMIYHEKYADTELHKRPFIMESNEWVDTLIKTYQFCSGCPNTLAKIDGYCSWCYPLATEQEDVCCVCHCNEGVWAKLECGHTMHVGCFKKIDHYQNADGKGVRKCPLCRKEMSVGGYETI